MGLLTVEQVQTATMVWNEKFLDLAFRGKFRLINYPIALENIGQVIGAEQFNTKAPNVKEYNSFMPALERAAEQGTAEDPEGKPVIRIVAWDPGELFRSSYAVNSLTSTNSQEKSGIGRARGSSPRREHRRALSAVGPTQPCVWCCSGRGCRSGHRVAGPTACRKKEG
jgi:hypothetical protein